MENYHQTKEQMFSHEETRMNKQLDEAAEKRNSVKALPHKFKTDMDVIDLAEVVGYTTALADILEYVNMYNYYDGKSFSTETEKLKQVIKETVLDIRQLKTKIKPI